MPMGSGLCLHSDTVLLMIERKLNRRPLETPGWRKPCEKFDELLALTA
jgi:IS30 family transposase